MAQGRKCGVTHGGNNCMTVEAAHFEAFATRPHVMWDAHIRLCRVHEDTHNGNECIELTIIVYMPRKCSIAIQTLCIQDALRQAKDEYMRTKKGHISDPYREYCCSKKKKRLQDCTLQPSAASSG